MVQLSQISFSYGPRTLFRDVNLSVGKGARIALTGDNGSGKSTLMRLAAGMIRPDSGSIIRNRESFVSYLPQSGLVHRGRTLWEEAETSFERYHAIEREKHLVEEALGESSEDDEETGRLLERQHELQESLLRHDFYRRAELIERILTGLGFDRGSFGNEVSQFSGGWQMRIGLAKVLLEQPDVLLLDEPTNYLDIEARSWLREFLGTFPGGILIVSHDRFFLDMTVREVAELFNGKLTIYKGNYTEYVKLRETEVATLMAAYRKQQEEMTKIEEFIRKFRYNASKAAMVQSRVRQLEKIKPIEVPESLKSIKFTFPKAPHSGKKVLELSHLYRAYADNRVLNNVNLRLERGEKLFLAGVNGSGKSTLMRIIAGRDDGYTGEVTVGAGVTIGYFSPESDDLDISRTVIDEVTEDAPSELVPTLRNLLGAFLFRGDDIFKQVSVLSGGERSRLALLKLLLHPINLLVLDEPTNHLDMASKDVLLHALRTFTGTLVFVSHDRYFVERLATKVLELDRGRWKIYPGDYSYFAWRKEQEPEGVSEAQAEAGRPPDGQQATPEREGDRERDDITEPEASPDEAEPKQTQGASQAGRQAAARPGLRPSRYEIKRQAAEIRKLERQEEETMAQLEVLEKEHGRLMNELALPENYLDGAKVKTLKEQLSMVEDEQAACTVAWDRVESNLRKARETAYQAGRPTA